MKYLLILWIEIKLLISKLCNWIHPIYEELKFVKENFNDKFNELSFRYISLNEFKLADFCLLKTNIKYKPDKLFNFIPFDWQYDSIKLFNNNGGDCNSLHRLIQCFYHNLGYETYLLTFLAKPFKKSHTTCIAFKDNNIYSIDYGQMIKYNIKDNIIKLFENSYNCKIKTYILQNINWKIVDLKIES